MRRACAFWAAALVALGAASAEAGPSRWARARDPAIDRQETLLADVEALELRYRLGLRLHYGDRAASEVDKLYLRQARDLLEQGGVATARDPAVRFRLAEVYHLLEEDTKAVPIFASILRDNPSAPVLADTYGSLAISYARLGKHEEEIKAYDGALRLQPDSRGRASLLANRAEAYMALGDITAAVEGYRQALSLLSAFEMFRSGATTLWGLATALDRSGDLDSALAAIRLARTYDPADKWINGPDWFYVPWYDKYYYKALGQWSAARAAEVNMAKDEDYRQSIGSWEEYIASAPPEDKWLGLARARLLQCEQERDAWLRGVRRKAAQGDVAPPPQKWPGHIR